MMSPRAPSIGASLCPNTVLCQDCQAPAILPTLVKVVILVGCPCLLLLPKTCVSSETPPRGQQPTWSKQVMPFFTTRFDTQVENQQCFGWRLTGAVWLLVELWHIGERQGCVVKCSRYHPIFVFGDHTCQGVNLTLVIRI
jgi:hypothetical protein